jgi:hypothetical protein
MLTAFRLLLALALTAVLSGCASNYYNVPRDAFEKKVRVLGVAPIFVDTDSDIRHPDREALVNLIREYNRASQKELVMRIKDTGTFFSVVRLDEDGDQLFQRLFSRRELRDDAGIVYNKYFYKEGDIRELMRKNSLDAVMLVVVSGISKQDKIYSKSLPPVYLDTSYNYLIMTAQILDSERTILWEYPNFRKSPLSARDLLPLQYPAFDEAAANLSDKVEVRFKTIPGITRALMQKEKDILFREQNASALYGAIFDDMAGLLKPPPQWFGNAEKPIPTSP